MESYSVQIKRSAANEIERVPKKDRARIVARIRELTDNPRPGGSQKLSGRELYRVRQGDYRVVYLVDDAERVVTVYSVGHRRDVYR